MNSIFAFLVILVIFATDSQSKPIEVASTEKREFAYSGNIEYQPQKSITSKADYLQNHQLFSIHNATPDLNTAIIEQESLLSKKDSAYTGLHEQFANTFHYKPIVDTIKHEDKFGNEGDRFRKLGKIVVGKAEGLANFLNVAVDVPYKAFKTIVRKTSDKLNHLGGKIVGLER